MIANDNAETAPANTTFVAGSLSTSEPGISGNLFSPYVEQDRAFFTQSISAPGYTASTKVPYEGVDEVALAYKDSVWRGLTDSPDFQVLVRLANVDADGDSISWTYKEDNVPRRMIVGHDTDGYLFQLKKFKYDSENPHFSGFHHNAKITFNSSKINSDSSSKQFHVPNSLDKIPMPPLTVLYDRFGAECTNGDNFLSKYLTIEHFDSDANTTINFIYDSYPHVNTISGVIPGTVRKISTIDGPTFILDSIGALP